MQRLMIVAAIVAALLVAGDSQAHAHGRYEHVCYSNASGRYGQYPVPCHSKIPHHFVCVNVQTDKLVKCR